MGKEGDDMDAFLRHIMNVAPERQIVLRGFTATCRKLCDELRKINRTPVAIADQNPSYAGKNYEGVPIVMPEEANGFRDAIYIILVRDVMSVIRQLRDAGVPEENIVDWQKVCWSDIQQRNAAMSRLTYEQNRELHTRELFTRSRLDSRPVNIQIETSVDCNLNCAMCGFHDESVKKRHVESTRCLFTSESFDPLLASTQWVNLYGCGEPLMKPLFWQFLDAVKKHSDASVRVVTNGTLLHAENRARLLDSPVKLLEISLDGASERSYWRIRGFDFNRVVRNVTDLVRERDRAGRSDIEIRIAMVVMRENVEELEAMVVLCDRMGVDTVFVCPLYYRSNEEDWITRRTDRNSDKIYTFYYYQQKLQFYPNLTAESLSKAYAVAKRIGVDFREREPLVIDPAAQDIEYPLPVETFRKEAERFLSRSRSVLPQPASSCSEPPPAPAVGGAKCGSPWNSFLVNANGDTTICCHLPLDLCGNVYVNTFDEVWNSESACNVRRGIIEGRYSALCVEVNCPYSHMIANEGGSIKPLEYGRMIHFDRYRNNVREYVDYSGLTFPDFDGMWFNKRSGEIRYLPHKRSDHTVCMKLRPGSMYQDRSLPVAFLTIGGEQHVLYSTKGEPEDFTVPVPMTALDGDGVLVYFEFPASDTDEPDDCRILQILNMNIADL